MFMAHSLFIIRPPQVTSHRGPRADGSLDQAVRTNRVLGRYKIDTCRWLLHV